MADPGVLPSPEKRCDNFSDASTGPFVPTRRHTRGAIMTVTTRLFVFALALLSGLPALAQNRRGEQWVATWATALVSRPVQQGDGRGQGPAAAAPQAPANTTPPTPAAPVGPPTALPGGGGRGFVPPTTMTNQTIRQIVRTSIGGNRVRVVLSNAFGTSPIDVGAGHIALRDKESAIVGSSARPLTVSGASTFSILPGATIVSDPIDMTVAPVSDLVVVSAW
jgi:hypothetical protein